MRAKRVHQPIIHYCQQILQNRLDFCQNLHIAVSHNAQPAAPKPGITTGIGSPPLGAEMLTAVHFDDQVNRGRPKIRDERSQWPLPVKLDVAQLPATYVPPKLQLGIGHAFAQASRTLPLYEVTAHERVLMGGSDHHCNGGVRVHREDGAAVCKPLTRFARIPPDPPSQAKGGSVSEEGGKLGEPVFGAHSSAIVRATEISTVAAVSGLASTWTV